MLKSNNLFWFTRIIFVLVLSIIVSGCASQNINLGLNAYNQGNYDLAAKYWNPIAKQGNPIAQYNVGLLWEQGLGSTTINTDEASQWFLLSAQQGYVPAMVRLARIQKDHGLDEAATSWLIMAARWGNSEAANELEKWGEPTPTADLLAAQQYRDAISRQAAINALGETAYQLGKAIGGGASGNSPTYSPSSNSIPSYSGGASDSAKSERGCTSDYNCGIGLKCVKAPLTNSGVCMKSVNEYGINQYNSPSSNSVGPNLDADGECSFDTDCEIGFRCDRNYKACIK